MLIFVLAFLIALFFLAKGSQVAVNSAIKLAKITKLEEFVIGFILISVTTSLPEFAVSFSALIAKSTEISLGNLLGSNIANLGLILGLQAIMVPIIIGRKIYEKLLTLLFLSSLVPLLLLVVGEASYFIGILLISIFLFFTFYSMEKRIVLKIPPFPRTLLERISKSYRFYKNLIIFSIALFCVIYSASWVVSLASVLARFWGVAESLIGATIIAVGTSLPELSISFLSMRKRRYGLALGNIIGSCLTNLTLILGLTLLFLPLKINFNIFSTVLFFVLGVTLFTWYFLETGRRLNRKEGIILLFSYIFFLMTTFGVQITLI